MARFDLNLLASLDALLQHRSVTAAAKEIGVSQPTMSGMLGRLRVQLQDPLLVRVGKDFELTPRAEQLKNQVRQLLLSTDELIRPNEDLPLARTARHVRIMASEYVQLAILPHLFRAADREASLLTFEILPIMDPIGRVFQGEVDLCFTGLSLGQVSETYAEVIRTQMIRQESFVALVDIDHPLGDRASLQELDSYPHVVTQFPGLSLSVEDVIRDPPPAPEPVIRTPSFITTPAAVVGTRRICVMPESFISFLPMSASLRAVSLPENYGLLALRMLWHVRHDADPVHRWLRSQALDAAGVLR